MTSFCPEGWQPLKGFLKESAGTAQLDNILPLSRDAASTVAVRLWQKGCPQKGRPTREDHICWSFCKSNKVQPCVSTYIHYFSVRLTATQNPHWHFLSRKTNNVEVCIVFEGNVFRVYSVGFEVGPHSSDSTLNDGLSSGRTKMEDFYRQLFSPFNIRIFVRIKDDKKYWIEFRFFFLYLFIELAPFKIPISQYYQ